MSDLQRRSIAINMSGAPLLGDLTSSAVKPSPLGSAASSSAAAPSAASSASPMKLDLSGSLMDTPSLMDASTPVLSPRASDAYSKQFERRLSGKGAPCREEGVDSLEKLPITVILSVIDYLESPADILRLGMTCHQMLFVTDELQDVWKVFVQVEFGQTLIQALEERGKTKKKGFCWRRKYSGLKILFNASEVPLHWCADHAANEKIKAIVRSGTPADWMEERQHRTALQIAAARGHLKTVALLIAAGADVNARSSDQRTAVHYACKFGCVDVLKLLLKKGAQLDVKDKWDKTGLEYAVTLSHVQVVLLFLEIGLNVNYRFARNRTMLHVACAQNHEGMIDLLLSKKSNVNAQDEDQRTPLHFASQRGFTEIVQKLLKAECDPTVKDAKGYIALDFARGKANLATTRTLINWYKERKMEVPKPPPNVKSLIPKAKNTNRLIAMQLDEGTDRNAVAREMAHARSQFAALRKR